MKSLWIEVSITSSSILFRNISNPQKPTQITRAETIEKNGCLLLYIDKMTIIAASPRYTKKFFVVNEVSGIIQKRPAPATKAKAQINKILRVLRSRLLSCIVSCVRYISE